ncbi:hypothetical protein VIGAN_11251000, partial [Vigna angularis var. angularis]
LFTLILCSSMSNFITASSPPLVVAVIERRRVSAIVETAIVTFTVIAFTISANVATITRNLFSSIYRISAENISFVNIGEFSSFTNVGSFTATTNSFYFSTTYHFYFSTIFLKIFKEKNPNIHVVIMSNDFGVIKCRYALLCRGVWFWCDKNESKNILRM